MFPTVARNRYPGNCTYCCGISQNIHPALTNQNTKVALSQRWHSSISITWQTSLPWIWPISCRTQADFWQMQHLSRDPTAQLNVLWRSNSHCVPFKSWTFHWTVSRKDSEQFCSPVILQTSDILPLSAMCFSNPVEGILIYLIVPYAVENGTPVLLLCQMIVQSCYHSCLFSFSVYVFLCEEQLVVYDLCMGKVLLLIKILPLTWLSHLTNFKKGAVSSLLRRKSELVLGKTIIPNIFIVISNYVCARK